MSAEIEGELLLELLVLELKSSEQRNPESGEDLEAVGNNMDFEDSSDVPWRVER